ncbi:MAG: SemiSWEET family transporter [Gammaproteobacteria bacterium]|nr:SemiSWEET family transporter [Gammaproteobacteria bacterium]
MSAEEISGWLAAILTTLIFVPQLHKAFTTKKTQDISMLMIMLAILGNTAWFVQASLTSNIPLMVCAVLIIIMSMILMVFKYNNDKKQKE